MNGKAKPAPASGPTSKATPVATGPRPFGMLSSSRSATAGFWHGTRGREGLRSEEPRSFGISIGAGMSTAARHRTAASLRHAPWWQRGPFSSRWHPCRSRLVITLPGEFATASIMLTTAQPTQSSIRAAQGRPRYPGPSLAGGEPPGTGWVPRAARRNSMRAAGMRSCSRASRASARASAAVGRFRSRARGHSRA